MYENNGGTVIGAAGDNFVILAGDTRLSQGYSILCRHISRIWEVSPGIFMGIGGCYSDAISLAELVTASAQSYQWDQIDNPGVEVSEYHISIYKKNRQ